METENNSFDEVIKTDGDFSDKNYGIENKDYPNFVTTAQQVLIAKILRSSKLSDKEYKTLKSFDATKVITKYDASILIDYVLSTLKFRRHFFNSRHKAYKKCYFCNSRDNVKRFADAVNLKRKVWACETCALNLPDKVVSVPLRINNEN